MEATVRVSSPSATTDMSILPLLASRYAFSRQNRHRRSSIRIAVGLALGLFAIVTVLSFMQALQRNQFKDIRALESFDLQIGGSDYSLAEARHAAETIGGLDGITAAFVWAELPIIIQGEQGRTISARIRALDGPSQFLDEIKHYKGTPFGEGELSSSWANYLWIKEGDEITITYLRRGRQATIVPASKRIPIGSIYYTSSWEFDQTTLLSTLSTLASITDDVTYNIGIYTDLDAKRAKRIIAESGFEGVRTYQEVNAALWGAMELEQKMMALMLLLMVVIVLVHAYSSTRRLLAAKQREVAMLMTMGAARSTVCGAFVLQAAIITAIGLAGGIILSYGGLALYPHLSNLVYRHMGVRLVLSIEAGHMLLLCIGILAFSLLSALVAVRRLLGSDIMEMFVYEEIY